MYLLTFTHRDSVRYGFRTADEQAVVDVLAAEKQLFAQSCLPGTLQGLIEDSQAQARLKEIFAQQARLKDDCVISFSQLNILAPLPEPKRDIICIGLNYRDHVTEFTREALPKGIVVFTKATSAVIGPEQQIKRHAQITEQVDYEAELAVVIGREGTHIAPEDAQDYIFGYTIINDVTARDLQKKHSQWFIGKGLDTFAPMGPFLVTADEIAWPVKLDIQSRINGELRQKANTELLIFDIPTIIAIISEGITLKPGDIIATGTPKGVGMGFDPPRFLNEGDVVEIEIEKLGSLRNTVV